MPELPEVETICRGLAPRLVGRRFIEVQVRRPGLRLPFPDDMALRLTGRRVTALTRRAKYLLMQLDDGAVLIIHLGMSGRMVILDAPGSSPGRHDHVIFVTDDQIQVVFNDPRRFGLMTLSRAAELEGHPLLAELGPEPLDPAFTGKALAARLAGRKSPIKAALLDQRVVAGLGNIYVSEALFYAGVSPLRPAGEVSGATAQRLAKAIRKVLRAAIAAGGSSLRDYVQASGELGYFQHDFAVYGRTGQPCPGCDCQVASTGGVVRLTQGNRSTFWCPRRQD